MTEGPDWERALVRARARCNLAERALREAVNDAALAGVEAVEIAPSLKIARQDAVKLVARLERERGADGRLPTDAYAVAERYAVGELSRTEMLATLTGWRYTPEKVMRGYSDDIGVTAEGSFRDRVGRAFGDGLIDGEDYEAIRLGRKASKELSGQGEDAATPAAPRPTQAPDRGAER